MPTPPWPMEASEMDVLLRVDDERSREEILDDLGRQRDDLGLAKRKEGRREEGISKAEVGRKAFI